MAVRDFVDLHGVTWRVWPVTPSSIQPKTAAEDYLGDYEDGWLCFECNTERRRLAKYPRNWDTLSDNGLLQLLKTAAKVAPNRRTPPKAGGQAPGP